MVVFWFGKGMSRDAPERQNSADWPSACSGAMQSAASAGDQQPRTRMQACFASRGKSRPKPARVGSPVIRRILRAAGLTAVGRPPRRTLAVRRHREVFADPLVIEVL